MRTRNALTVFAVPIAMGLAPGALLAASAGYVAHHPVSQPTLTVEGPVAVGDEVAFEVSRSHGSETRREVWRSDGTVGGTRLVLDERVTSSATDRLVAGRELDGELVFARRSFDHGWDLWQSDLTLAGTFALGDLLPVTPEPPEVLGRVGDRWLLNVVVDGCLCLWASDGTRAGTERLTEEDSHSLLATLGDRALLRRYRGRLSSPELWVTDGTADGTFRLAELAGEHAVAEDGIGYFLGADPAEGVELWTTDGTIAGTRRLTAGLVGDVNLVTFEVWRDRLWLAIEAPGGTAAVYSLTADGPPRPEPALAIDDRIRLRAAIDSALLFDASPPGEAAGLFAYGGGDVERLAAVIPTGELLRLADRWIFAAGPIWVTDGTAAGTGLWSTGAGAVAAAGGILFQVGTGGLYAGPPKVGGGDLVVSFPLLVPGVPPRQLTPWEGGFAYTVPGSADGGLWQVDGDPPTAARLALPPFGVLDVAALGQRLLYTEYDELVGLDPAGEEVLRVEVCGGESRLLPLGGATADGVLVFCDEGQEVWVSDGTTAGTGALVESSSGWSPGIFCDTGGCPEGIFFPRERTVLGDGPNGPRAVFTSYDRDEGFSLWATDGTLAGTAPLHVFTHEPRSFFVDNLVQTPRESIRLRDAIVFVAFDTMTGGWGLWRSDGTAAGTIPLRIFGGDPDDVTVHHLALFGGRLIFFARDGAGDALWTSDGTADGTRRVASLRHQGQAVRVGVSDPLVDDIVDSHRGETAVVGGRLFFVASTRATGEELWTTDGTAGGTRLVADLLPGRAGSSPRELFAIDDRILLSAAVAGKGQELWMVEDGALRLLEELESGVGSSWPRDFVRIGDRLYFVAHRTPWGDSLWTLDVADLDDAPPPPDACPLSSHCFQDGRFRVAVTWDDDRTTGAATPVAGASDDSGLFTFFSADNWEMLVKVLDGCAIDGSYWVFAAAATNVGYTIEVTDLETGAHRVYDKAFGPPAPALTATGAFACSP